MEIAHTMQAGRDKKYLWFTVNTLLLIYLAVVGVCFAQTDTLYLYEKYVELNGRRFNRVEDGFKTGKWKEFNIETNNSTLWLRSGEDCHWHDIVSTEYRPLKQGEYNGIEILMSGTDGDTINGQIYYSGYYIKIVNQVPPHKFYVSGEGVYKKNKKTGKWFYFYEDGNIKKVIRYKNGLPKRNFDIYRPDGTIMMEVIKIDRQNWKINKYTETGILIESKIRKINDLEALY